jgi:DNA-binding GntR family transcriptional regulator
VPAEYVRVYESVVALIRAGEWKPGDRLPSIVALAVQFGTSQTTVKSALMLLGRDGWTRGQQGKATFVSDAPPITESGFGSTAKT